MNALKRSVRLMRSAPDGLRKCASDWFRMRARSSGLNLATEASTPTTRSSWRNLQAGDVASLGPAWSNCATRKPTASPMELAMAATAATQFLPFLEPAEEEALLAAAPVRSYAPDELVFDQNVSLRAIFLIDKGAVRVERQDRGAMIPIAILGAGEFFGEMSFVDGTPTSARVIADETTRLIVIDTATVDALSTADPAFAGRLYRSIAAILAERLRLTSQRAYGDQSWG